MRLVSDLEIHSKYSRAVSKAMTAPEVYKWAKYKGINLVGTGDFTHPFWLSELKQNLQDLGNGLFKFKEELGKPSVYFLLSAEISSIYTQGGRGRRVHNIVFCPSFETAEKINLSLSKFGNLYSDGRPIIGISAKDLLKIVLSADSKALLIPAHIWTPWFSLFGSNSGFDSIEECFEELAKYIYAVETGLSSDPAMNWRLSQLDNRTILSFSDAHSAPNLGRELSVFEIPESEISYDEIVRIIKEKDISRFSYTVEFYPQEGMYHYDGHRNCGVRLSPQETRKLNKICPVCKKPLTVGVMHRVEDLANFPDGRKPEKYIPYKNLVQLSQIISESLGVGEQSKQVQAEYLKMMIQLGSEFEILGDLDLDRLSKFAHPKVVEGIGRVREGKVKIEPGYDGVYGTVKVFEEEKNSAQKSLF